MLNPTLPGTRSPTKPTNKPLGFTQKKALQKRAQCTCLVLVGFRLVMEDLNLTRKYMLDQTCAKGAHLKSN